MGPGYRALSCSSAVINILTGLKELSVSKDTLSEFDVLIRPIFIAASLAVTIQTT
jgi:hypothetical protein